MCQVATNGTLTPKENITIAASPWKQQQQKQKQPSGTQGKHMELCYNGFTFVWEHNSFAWKVIYSYNLRIKSTYPVAVLFVVCQLLRPI